MLDEFTILSDAEINWNIACDVVAYMFSSEPNVYSLYSSGTNHNLVQISFNSLTISSSVKAMLLYMVVLSITEAITLSNISDIGL